MVCDVFDNWVVWHVIATFGVSMAIGLAMDVEIGWNCLKYVTLVFGNEYVTLSLSSLSLRF